MRIFFTVLFVSLLSCNGKKEKVTSNDKQFVDPPDSTIVIPEKALNTYSPVDRSPMDMTYFPEDYPVLKMAGKTSALPKARVIYSRPYLQGRALFPKILKYGEPWRLGANEATELQLFEPATIQEKRIQPGRYILYCIPQADSWTIVLNSHIDSWGLHPDSTKDIARFTIPVKQQENFFEYFTIVFAKSTTGADLVMAWERLEARLPFRF